MNEIKLKPMLAAFVLIIVVLIWLLMDHELGRISDWREYAIAERCEVTGTIPEAVETHYYYSPATRTMMPRTSTTAAKYIWDCGDDRHAVPKSWGPEELIEGEIDETRN